MTTDIFALFATDEKLEVVGTWKSLEGGGKVRVARFGNKGFVKKCEQLRETHREELANDDDKAKELWDKLRQGAMAEHILVGWEGITQKGKEVPYSVEKAAEYLAIKDFRVLIEFFASDIDNFRLKEEEAQTKN